MKLSKVILLFVLLGSSGFAQTSAQHIEVAKSPGQPTTIYFWGLPAPGTFDGIAIESATDIQGPYTDVALTITSDMKSVTFGAPSVPTFYRTYTFKTVDGMMSKAAPSNVVLVSMIVTGLPPIAISAE